MTMSELVRRTRSTRHFREDRCVSREVLEHLVDLGRLAACEGNRQALKYGLSHRRETNERIFDLLGWAALLPDWPGPAQSILLGAAEAGLGACIVGTVDRDRLRRRFGLPDRFEILLVIALGEPGERVEIETVGGDGDTRYWRDDEGIHHVPKRRLEDVLVELPDPAP